MSFSTKVAGLLAALALIVGALVGGVAPVHAVDEDEENPCPELEQRYDDEDVALVKLENKLDRLVTKVQKARKKVQKAKNWRQKVRAKRVLKRVQVRKKQTSKDVDAAYDQLEATAIELEECWNDYYDENPDWDDDEDPVEEDPNDDGEGEVELRR